MPSFNFELARSNMILQQIRPWEVLNQDVLQIMADVPREKFVPPGMERLAFSDIELPLGSGEYMMAPKIEARLLQALNLRGDDHALEIGTGSGFLTACLARLAAQVDSVEIHETLLRAAEQRLQSTGTTNVQLQLGDAAHGWGACEYDAIAVTGSLPEYDPCFERLLKSGGRLFIVVGKAPVMEALLVTRIGHNRYDRTALFETSLKPLVGREPQPEFVF
ncbi:MAG: protein-L-isoaspartate O-methyltransferase [Thiotrichales bacterium]